MSLRRHLDTPTSPLRALLDEALPHLAACRPQVSAALSDATTISPDRGGSPPWSVLGHAISARLLWELEPTTDGAVGGTSLGTAAFWLQGQAFWDPQVRRQVAHLTSRTAKGDENLASDRRKALQADASWMVRKAASTDLPLKQTDSDRAGSA